MKTMIRDTENKLDTYEIEDLKKLFNTVDWIDFGLVFAVIGYMATGLYGNTPLLGIVLCLASLGACISAILISRVLRKKGAITKTRMRVRYVVWGIWIPLDIAFIGYYILNIMGIFS